jgi:hypothetical protein
MEVIGVNGGRIGEISKGHKYLYVEPNTKDLPPPGPYLSGKASNQLIGDLQILRSRTRTVSSQSSLTPEVRDLVKGLLEHVERTINKHQKA